MMPRRGFERINKMKIQYWQIKQKTRELVRKMLGDDSNYDDEIFSEINQLWIDYLDVGKYLEQRHEGVDLVNKNCPYCKKAPDVLEIASLYENLPNQNKRMAFRFLQTLLDERDDISCF